MAETANNSAPGTPGAVDSSRQHALPSVGGFTNDQIQEMAKSLVSSGQLSEQQAAAMYTQGLVDSGAMTPEQAAEHLKAAGVTPQAGTLEQTIDSVRNASSTRPLQPTVRKHLESLGMNPARDIAEYQFPRVETDSGGFPTQQDMQKDILARNWLMAGGLSAGNGSAIAEEIARVGTAYEAMSEIDRTIWRQQQEQIARKILSEFGQDANKRIALAKQLVHEIDERYPGLKQFLDATGAGSSAMLIVKLAEQAEALARRQA